MTYLIRDINGSMLPSQPSKIVCVGRNYVEHIKELNNIVPDEPLLFMKPSTTLVSIEQPIRLPLNRGLLAHEIELAILIDDKSFSHVALALDLTLRDLQTDLKKKGHPWEKAKAFDDSCPISPFIPCAEFENIAEIEFSLIVNGIVRQQGCPAQMITPIAELIKHINQHFTLLPGDIVLTGTPSGVGTLLAGDRLELVLNNRYRFSTQVEP